MLRGLNTSATKQQVTNIAYLEVNHREYSVNNR